MTINSFRKMDKHMQNSLRREYKLRYTDEYNYSIQLFCLYTASGIFSLLSLAYALFFNYKLGFAFFIAFFITLMIILNYLKKSNQAFYTFLEQLDRHI